MPRAGLPGPGGGLGTVTGISPADVAYFLQMLMTFHPRDPRIQALVTEARAKNRDFDLNSVVPAHFSTFLDIENTFGDLTVILGELQKFKLPQFTPSVIQSLYQEAQEDIAVTKSAARLADFPQIELKHVRVSYLGRDKRERLVQLEAQRQGASASTIQTINSREKQLRDRWVRFIPVTPLEELEFKKLHTDIQSERIHLSHIHNQRTQARNRLSGQSLRRRLDDLKFKESRHRRELQRHESRLKALERQQVDLYEVHQRNVDHVLSIEEAVEEDKRKLAKKRNGPALVAAQEQSKKRENALLAEAYRLRANVPDRNLHYGPRHKARFLSDGRYRARENELEEVVYDSIAAPDGSIDRRKFKTLDKKSTQRAASRYHTMLTIERSLSDSIKAELEKANPVGGSQNERIAREIARALSPRVADSHDTILQKGGTKAAARVPLDIVDLAFDQRARQTAIRIIMKELLETDPYINTPREAEIVASSLIDDVNTGIRLSSNISSVNKEYKLLKGIGRSRELRKKIPPGATALVCKETEFVPNHMGSSMMVKRSRKAIVHSVEDVAEAFSLASRTKEEIQISGRIIDSYIYGEEKLDGKLGREARQAREARRVAFVQGVMAAKKQLEEDPLGAVPIIVGTYLYGLTPASLQRSTIATRSLLIGLSLSTVLGPGALPFATAGAFTHAAKWYKDEWDKRFLPIAKTDQWALNFAKGTVYGFIPILDPLLSYDQRGNLEPYGIGAAASGFHLLMKGLGGAIEQSYQRRYMHLRSQLGTRKAKDQARKDTGLTIRLLISERLKDDKKRTNPISLLFGIGWAVVKGSVISALERVGALPAFRHFLRHNGGDLWADLRFGAGYSDPVRLAQIRKELIDDLPIRPGSPDYPGKIAEIDTKLNRLKTFGNVLKKSSAAWDGIKIGIEGFVRGGVVTTVAFLFGMSLPAALAVGAGYTVPWAIRSILTNPKYGGFFEWTGGYHPGMINPNSSWGRLAQAMNTPLDAFHDLSPAIGLGQRYIAGFSKLFPWDGFWVGTALVSLGLPWPVAFGVPMGLDFSVRALAEISKFQKFAKFFAPTGLWAKFTGGISVIFNIGSLSFALEHGGFSGLFDVFRHFSIENLMKFSTIPSTYLSFIGLFGALGLSAVFGMPLYIAAGVFTGGLIIVDQLILRPLGYEYGLWTIFKKPLEGIWNFFKNKGLGLATSAFAAIAGFFGAFSAAMRGDIQGLAISVIMMIVGGYTFFIAYDTTIPIPSAYYKPTEGKEVKGNLFIRSASKRFVGLNDPENDELTYEYSFYTSSSDSITTLSLTETDTFSGIDPDSISLLSTDTTFGIDKDGENFIISHSADDYKPASKYTRKFTIGLPDKLENILSDDEELCNTLVIEINNIVKNDGTEEVPEEENILQKVCIDREGNMTEMFSHLPIDPGKGVISSCYECRKLPRERKESLHEGIDIATSIGTPIYAIGSGTVEKAEKWGGFGNYVKINHGENTVSYYAHMIEFYVNTGDHVQGGEQIGAVGKTGYSTGPHLHFQIDVNGESVNPCLMINICEHVYKGATCDSIPENRSDPTIDCL